MCRMMLSFTIAPLLVFRSGKYLVEKEVDIESDAKARDSFSETPCDDRIKEVWVC